MSETSTATSRRWWALGLIAAAQFMVIMDTSIIGVALPKMQGDLGFSPGNLSWVFNAYVVAFGGLLLLGGRLSDLLGARRVFATGWAVLLVGSVLAGLANGVGLELAGRAVQGVGAALIAPAALTLLMMLFGGNPGELTKAIALVRRRGSGRWDGWRVPRRGDHPVPLVAMGVLPQRADRAGGADRHTCLDAGRVRASRIGRPAGRLDRHRGAWGRRLRHRPGTRDRLGLGTDVAGRCGGGAAVGRVRRDPGGPAGAVDAAGDLAVTEPGRGQRRPAAARCGVGADVVLPQPLPAAGPRPERLPERLGVVADDNVHHARHDRGRTATHRSDRPEARPS